MSSLWTRANHRVVIEPYVGHYAGDDEGRVAARIEADVKRHIDDVARVYTVSDRVCILCGLGWEEPPQCCDAAIDGWQAAYPEWTLDEDYSWHKSEPTP